MDAENVSGESGQATDPISQVQAQLDQQQAGEEPQYVTLDQYRSLEQQLRGLQSRDDRQWSAMQRQVEQQVLEKLQGEAQFKTLMEGMDDNQRQAFEYLRQETQRNQAPAQAPAPAQRGSEQARAIASQFGVNPDDVSIRYDIADSDGVGFMDSIYALRGRAAQPQPQQPSPMPQPRPDEASPPTQGTPNLPATASHDTYTAAMDARIRGDISSEELERLTSANGWDEQISAAIQAEERAKR